MDERQAQIRERAGLEESRLNLEFIEWLRKWGSPLLVIVAVAALAWTLRERYTRSANEKLDRAFGELEAARAGDNPSPDALLAVANEYEGLKSVSSMARLEAADAYLDGVRRGVKLGAVLKKDDKGQTDGTLESQDDVLTPDVRTSYLSKADELYQKVYDDSSKDASQLLTSLNAMYGLAAVAEGQEKPDQARAWYEKIAKATTGTAFESHAAIASGRIARLDVIERVPAPLPRSEIPKAPAPPAPAAPPVTLTPMSGPAGSAPVVAPGTPATTPPPMIQPGTTPAPTPAQTPPK